MMEMIAHTNVLLSLNFETAIKLHKLYGREKDSLAQLEQTYVTFCIINIC